MLGKYRCFCAVGYLLDSDNKTCVDINECGIDNGECSHICHNLENKYTCSCPEGYYLSSNNHTCHDIDECDLLDNDMKCSHGCINSEGSFRCTCPQGLVLSIDSLTCIDVNECGIDNGNCSHNCRNYEGNYKCLCPIGSQLKDDLHTCTDINECQQDNGRCSHKCINTDHGYECQCEEGYSIGTDGHTCHDINECDQNNGGCSEDCYNTKGSFRCECPAGYVVGPDGKMCQDIDECALANGGCSHACRNNHGSFLCGCPIGYELAEDNLSCLDVNECERSPCDHNCFNTLGSFYCDCEKGFKLKFGSFHICEDVNECEEKNSGCAQDCSNTIGSYHCGCTEEFVLNKDEHSCDLRPVYCPVIVAPLNGDMECSHDLEGLVYPRGTTCTFKCAGDTVLEGSHNTTCSSKGIWSQQVPTCEKTSKCPVLSSVKHGRISPKRCIKISSDENQHCYVSCAPGYKVVGNPIRTCDRKGSWLPENSSPYCEKGDALTNPPVVYRTFQGFDWPYRRHNDSLKPFIKCPNDVTVDLAPHQRTAYVRLPQPKANVDWFRFVDASPSWAKQLESDFYAGKTVVTFVARSPLSNETASCSLVVEVVDKEAPLVFGCPKSFNVQIEPSENSVEVLWKEPVFKDNVEVVHLWKSMDPGKRLRAGTYPIHYVAMDAYKNRAKCSFRITVHALSQFAQGQQELVQVFAVCPGSNAGRPILMYALHVPPECTVVGAADAVRPAPWDTFRTHTPAVGVSPAVGGRLHPTQERTLPPSVYDPSALPQTNNQITQSEPVRGDLASPQGGIRPTSDFIRNSNFFRRHSHSFHERFQQNVAMALAQARGVGASNSGTSSAFAQATGSSDAHAYAHAQASSFRYRG